MKKNLIEEYWPVGVGLFLAVLVSTKKGGGGGGAGADVAPSLTTPSAGSGTVFTGDISEFIGPIASNVAYTLGSVMNDTSLPRGIRNNNPGNIMFNSGNAWLGKLKLSKDMPFEQFYSISYGVRACHKLINNYYNSGRNTLRKIFERYVQGATAAKIQAYAEFVRKELAEMGTPITTIDSSFSISTAMSRNIVIAIFYYENGKASKGVPQLVYGMRMPGVYEAMISL